MSEADRARVRGFIVNRFRGDVTLLEDAHCWVKRHTGRPVLGVMPYLVDLRLPQEDRLSVDAGRHHFGSVDAPIHIAVVIPPHVSNTTDIDPLLDEPDVHLHLVERPSELGHPDVVVLLGTKSSVSDLLRLRESGLERVVVEAQRAGVEIVGICGGLQMLGERILDPAGVESAPREVAGLGLLPIETRFVGDKLVRPVRARHLPSGTVVVGYEIHHGTTDFGQLEATIVDDQDRVLGGGVRDQLVWGTYVHGVFDSDAFRAWFLDRVRARKGLLPLGTGRHRFGHEAAFTQLAKAFRAHVDYDAILHTMGLR
jgi:cobyric acid synthase